MANQDTAILDFGSQKITVLIGSRDVNNTINIRCLYEENYEGFMDGEFITPDNLEQEILASIKGAEKICGRQIKNLTVGVPTEFCFCMCKSVTKTFQKQKRITKRDIDELFDSVDIDLKTHTVINRDSVYYVLGESNKVKDPIGQIENKITACLSFILADNSFLNFVSKILVRIGLDEFNFVSSAYAQSLYLFDEEERDKYVLMVDCGYITTTVMLARGNGILNLTSFSLGGGHIAADLSKCLKIPFNASEQLLRKIVLCIEPDENDTYDIMVDRNVIPVSMRVANAIVESRIEVIVQVLQKCFSSWQYNFPDFIPIKLTGGGLSFIKGGKDVLSKLLGKNVEVISLPYNITMKTNYSSCMAVLNFAINNN